MFIIIGVTLFSCLSKLFTSILNERIVSYCNKYNVNSDAHFGFRRGLSTTDEIFSLHFLVQHPLQNKNVINYVAFVDLKICFDSIYRNGLWLKLYKSSIDSKVLRILRYMYTNVKSRVKQYNDLSDFIELILLGYNLADSQEIEQTDT